MTTFTTEDRIAVSKNISEHVNASYADIAKELGVSKARVQQIEESALQKLKKKMIWRYDVFGVKDLL